MAIALFGSGRSILDLDIKSIHKDHTCVFLNYAPLLFNEYIDILSWGDYQVGDWLYDYLKTKPSYKLICHEGHGGKSKKWVDEFYKYPKSRFTIAWTLQWLEKYNQEIKLFAFRDGTTGNWYDDLVNREKPNYSVTLPQSYKQVLDLDLKNLYIAQGGING